MFYPISHYSWQEYLSLLSCLTSLVGLWLCFQDQLQGTSARYRDEDLDENEAMSATLIRMTFVYWIVYCLTTWTLKLWGAIAQDLECSLHILAVLTFILTFCCILTLPLHLIEQRRRQPQ